MNQPTDKETIEALRLRVAEAESTATTHWERYCVLLNLLYDVHTALEDQLRKIKSYE